MYIKRQIKNNKLKILYLNTNSCNILLWKVIIRQSANQ